MKEIQEYIAECHLNCPNFELAGPLLLDHRADIAKALVFERSSGYPRYFYAWCAVSNLCVPRSGYFPLSMGDRLKTENGREAWDTAGVTPGKFAQAARQQGEKFWNTWASYEGVLGWNQGSIFEKKKIRELEQVFYIHLQMKKWRQASKTVLKLEKIVDKETYWHSEVFQAIQMHMEYIKTEKFETISQILIENRRANLANYGFVS